MNGSKNHSEQPLVSVIITTKNSDRTLERCLKSLQSQTYPNLELMVVDNNSTDRTTDIVKSCGVALVTFGPERSAQRNHGAKLAQGEWILIHDSDIYFHPNSVQECVDLCVANQADAAILPEVSIGEGFWTKVKSFERSFYLGNDCIEAVRFFKRNLFLEIGGYNEELTGAEDWDLTIRFRNHGSKIIRTKLFLEHDEGRLDFFGSSTKKKYYAQDVFTKYAKLHPEWFQKQMSFFQRFPISKILTKGVRHPILFLCMILLKGMEYRNSRQV